jgi:hypothetical protein
MPKKSTKQKQLSGRLLSIGRGNLAVVAVFILTFAGFGSFFVFHSEASTWYCAQHLYYEYEWSGGCVQRIQEQLSWQDGAGISPDGVFGPQTAWAVRSYNQRHVYGSSYQCPGSLQPRNSCFEVTASTWNQLCYWSYSNNRQAQATLAPGNRRDEEA